MLWFGGALRALCLLVALAAGVPPRPPKALTGLRSLRSRTAYGVPKGRGRSAREKLQGSVSRLANSRQLRSHKAVSCRGFATASRVCRLTESLWRLNYSAGYIGGRSLRPRYAPASLPIKRCLAAATPPQGVLVGSAPLARGNLSTPRRGTMPPPFGLPSLRVDHARLSRSVGGLRGCFLSSLPLDSILRAFFVCSVLPHGARANYFGGGFAFGALRQWSALRPSARVGCPRSRFRTRGPNSPRLPPGFARRAVVGLRPPFLSAPASPLPSAARAMGAASPGCKGRRLFAGAFRVAGGWGVRLPGRFYPSGVCRFYRSLVAYGVLRAPLCFARGTP